MKLSENYIKLQKALDVFNYFYIENNISPIYDKSISRRFCESIYVVENSIEKMVEIFKKSGYVELRPYKGEKSLLIACGNQIPNYYISHYEKIDPIEIDAIEEIEKNEDVQEYLMTPDGTLHADIHKHEGCYTVDLDHNLNPSIIAAFGDNPLITLPDGIFSKIIIEFPPSIIVKNEFFISECLRLLENKGKIYCTFTQEKQENKAVTFQLPILYKHDNMLKSLINFEGEKQSFFRDSSDGERLFEYYEKFFSLEQKDILELRDKMIKKRII